MNFKSGNDLYRKKQYDEAIRSYEKSLLSANKAVEAALNYNIGNCKFRQGKTKEVADLAAAIADYRSSLDYYKRAMELDQNDKEAKFNHEFVERLLKKQKSGQQGQKSEEQQKKEKQEQAKQQDQQRKEHQQQQAQQDKKEPQEQRESGGDISASGKEPDKEMSKQEAKMLLDDFRQREQQDRQLSDKHKPQGYPDVEKDW